MTKSGENRAEELIIELNIKFCSFIKEFCQEDEGEGISSTEWEEILLKFKFVGYWFKSDFIKSIIKYQKKITQIERQSSYENKISQGFKTIKDKIRLLLIKKQLKDYLETCEPGSNFYIKDSDLKVIGFIPSMDVINLLNKFITNVYDL